LNDLLTEKAEEQPIMLYITITGDLPLASLLAMLDAAHACNRFPIKKNYPFRVIFRGFNSEVQS